MTVKNDIYMEVQCNKKDTGVFFGYMMMEDFYVNQSLSTHIKYVKRV